MELPYEKLALFVQWFRYNTGLWQTDRREGTPFPTPHSVLSTPLCTWPRPCARMKMQASTNFIMSVCLYFRHRRVCCKQRELQWVRWLYEFAGQLRMYLYGWIHWRRIQLHRCVSVFVFNNNKWICNESTTNKYVIEPRAAVCQSISCHLLHNSRKLLYNKLTAGRSTGANGLRLTKGVVNSHDASTVVGVVNKFVLQRVLLTTRSNCSGEIFWVLSLGQHSGGKFPYIWIYPNKNQLDSSSGW